MWHLFQVEGPLKTATKVIKLSADHYTTEFSVHLFVSLPSAYIWL